MEQIKDTLRPPLTPVAVAVDLSAHALVTPIPQTLLAITVNREWLDYRWINFGDTIINQQGPRGNRSLICDNAQLLSLFFLSLTLSLSLLQENSNCQHKAKVL